MAILSVDSLRLNHFVITLSLILNDSLGEATGRGVKSFLRWDPINSEGVAFGSQVTHLESKRNFFGLTCAIMSQEVIFPLFR